MRLVVRKHTSFYAYALYFVLYAMLVMAIPGLIIASFLEPQFLDTASISRQGEMFAFAPMMTFLLFRWWMLARRYNAA